MRSGYNIWHTVLQERGCIQENSIVPNNKTTINIVYGTKENHTWVSPSKGKSTYTDETVNIAYDDGTALSFDVTFLWDDIRSIEIKPELDLSWMMDAMGKGKTES